MAVSLKTAGLVLLATLFVTKIGYSQDIPIVDGDVPSTPALGAASAIDILEFEHIQSRGLPPGLILGYRLRELSFGELVQWDFNDEAEKLGMSENSNSVKHLSDALVARREEMEENIQKLADSLGAISQLTKKQQETIQKRREAEELFLKQERKSEERLISVLDEFFPPQQYTSLMRYLVKTNFQRIGGSQLLAAYLKLTPEQIAAFEKVRKLTTNMKPDDSSVFIEALVAAEAGLNKEQTEEYWIATERMPDNQSLEQYFAALPITRKQELCKHYVVFRLLNAKTNSGNFDSSR